MNILFLPANIASMPALTAEALNRLPGIKAKCLSIGTHKYLTPKKETIVLVPYELKDNLIKGILFRIKKYYYFLKLFFWADIIHWTWDNFLSYDLDLRLIKFFKKPSLIEWVGSDIRVPEVAASHSPWYKEAFGKGYEYAAVESKEKSYALQLKFRKFLITPILVPEMQLYLKPGLFEKVYNIQYRIATKDYIPIYPSAEKKDVLIVHAPSAIIAKGSNYIIPVLEELEKKYNLKYKLLNNVPHEEALKTIQEADIFIDQLIIGSYAMAAMEAMCFGKPVIAYITPHLKSIFPEDCPIVNADAETLKDKIIELVLHPSMRNALGKKSRYYVEKYHDVEVVASELHKVYSEIKN